MKLPSEFQVANLTWRVRFKRLKHERGKANFRNRTITLDVLLKDDEEMMLQTFLHELLHVCSFSMGWDKVNNDEPRIDALAGLLAQAWQSQR